MNKISFLGLGVMGYPMAGHLARKSGVPVTVYNRTEAKAAQWRGEYDGGMASSPVEAATDADLVFSCVGNDDDLRAVMLGKDGVITEVKPGAVIVDHTTVSAEISQELAAAFAEKGCFFLDAPVSGGQSGAENGVLTVMVGGDAAAFAMAGPVMRSAYAREVRLMGASGAGQLTKMVNQICIAGLLQGLSEGLAFGQKAGLDMKEVIEVIGKGAAQSWQMDNRGQTMIEGEFDFGFAVDWMVKDLKIALAEAVKNGAALDTTETILGYYRELQDKDCGRLDTSSLIKRLTSSL
ncbi:MAG: NAD(P)-dependent oxidoreductase [Rhodospirillales bacterium]|nr:NAD(P)-dependent oxidoreductase [Rhodospirillales bacterium]